MKKVNIILVAAVIFSLASCGIFKKYADTTEIPDNLYGDSELAVQTAGGRSYGDLSWRELFTDPCLQTVIDSALSRNTTLAAAESVAEQAEALLKSAKLGYLPVISLNPSIYITPDQGYTVPVSGNWGIDGFGSITNRKREAQANALMAQDNMLAARSNLVAMVARAYYQLQLLDRELEIVTTTEEIWGKVLDTQIALMENGRAYSTSVNQMKASLYNVTLQKLDITNMIKDAEAAICLILRQTPRHIERSAWNAYAMPLAVSVDLPATMLEKRPDVRAAGRSLEAAYYVTNQARSAMLPGLTLSGLVGWGTNGAPISNPADMVYNAIASLTQPIFAQGKLRANLKVSKLQQQMAADAYVQTVISAGNDVNAALRSCELVKEKETVYKQQIAALDDAYSATQTLMSNGKATYIEVLTAQESLLNAQLGEVANIFKGRNGLIDLYVSLGGGVE